MKKVLSLLLITYLVSQMSSAHADYVLPYPSYMPGNILYKVSRFIDAAKAFWYWGNIASVTYHLALSDKYLIEAKTLMEYKQYLLGSDALVRSDREFMQLPANVAGAIKEGADVSGLKALIVAAADKHSELLTGLLSVTPDTFTWTPEKSAPTELPLGGMIRTSLGVRQHIASETGSLNP